MQYEYKLVGHKKITPGGGEQKYYVKHKTLENL